MSHQDDLQTDYNAASNEQPSESTDQLILQAAADAIKEDSKVVRGRFSFRRWQTPVSIAAAAVITVSVVTSLEPWQVSVPVTTSIPAKTAELSEPQSDAIHKEVTERLEKPRVRSQNTINDDEVKPSMEIIQAEAELETGAMIAGNDKADFAETKKLETNIVAAMSAPAEVKRNEDSNKQRLLKRQLVAKQQVQKGRHQAMAKAKTSPISLKTTIVYPKPRTLPLFKLLDSKGQPFSNEQLTGKWSVMFFGYTHCPDICPTTIAALARVADKLAPEISKQVQFIFISIDPERDSSALLHDYMSFFRPDFLAATGDEQQLQQLTMSLGAMYMKVPTENGYNMSHSSSLFIINPQGQRHGIISTGTSSTGTSSTGTGSQITGIIDVSSTADDLNAIIGSALEY